LNDPFCRLIRYYGYSFGDKCLIGANNLKLIAMKTRKILGLSIVYMVLFISMSCDKEDGTSGNNDRDSLTRGESLVPENEIYDGGPGKDGIPALNAPGFTGPDEATYLKDSDLVLGFVHNGVARAYPHNILDWHEIVNDSYDDFHMAVIYCPLTGTGIGWDLDIMGSVTTFGVSGLLYNSNIIPYDRSTDSNWSQMLLKAISGSLKGTPAETFNLVETYWGTWKSMFPETRVLSDQTGHTRNYTRYPYGNYKTSNSLIFPVNNEDNRLHKKDRVLGVLVEGMAKAYPIEKFGMSTTVIHDSFMNEDLVIAGNKEKNFLVAFKRDRGDGDSRQFTAVQNSLPVIIKDSEGTLYDVFGQAVDGPGKGNHLPSVTQFMGYWFAWAAFYPDIELF
jgi:hypothetical protein